nr:hypothetical protein GCM10020093_106330 [Planobispora longispora]
MRVLVAAIAGTGFLAASATLVRLSAVQPATAAVFRCAYAVPVLAVLALSEMRRHGPLPARRRRLAWLAGLFFSLDLILWHHSIRYVGAGIATVLGNLQVFVVSLAAWRLLRSGPHRGSWRSCHRPSPGSRCCPACSTRPPTAPRPWPG